MPPANRQAPSSSSLLIRRAQLLGRGIFDVRVEGEHIVEIAPQLPSTSADRVIDAAGNLLLPGLHDHHMHLLATAAARESLICGPPEIMDERSLARLLESQSAIEGGWIRGIGFHDSLCPELDRHWLDRVCCNRPVRIQHRSGMLWILNSLALKKLRLEKGEQLPAGAECDAGGSLNGRFYNLDAWLGARLERAWPSLAGLSRELASFGITGVTDTGVNNGSEIRNALSLARERGELAQRVLLMGSEELTPLLADAQGTVPVGPLKIYLRESDLPDYDVLVGRIGASHEQNRAVAIHCVTRVELHFALAALADAEPLPGDRIEHASVADDYALQRLAELGITVVTQPHFIAERGDLYLREVDAEDIPFLYRGAGFRRCGVPLAAGSDAPYGSTDPWAAMAASVARRTRDGFLMGTDEALSPLQALQLFGGSPRQPGGTMRDLSAGQPADLCLLDAPWEVLCEDLHARHVALTLCEGKVIYESQSTAMDA